jgi:hypothetical protein
VFWQRKKQRLRKDYDRTHKRPVIRKSICTGEETACFQNRETGKLEEIMLLRDKADFEEFLQTYGLRAEEVETIY